MYQSFILFHSWWRWAVVFFLLLAFLRSSSAWIFNFRYKREDKLLGRFLVASVHLQVLVGLILYLGLSPIIQMAMNNVSYAMKTPSLRYWLVEHFGMMFVFLVIVQVGQILSKRTIYDRQKHKRMAISTGLAILVLAVGMPWPGTKHERPLFRDFVKHSESR